MQSLAERKRELDTTIKGFLRPVFRQYDPVTDRSMNGLAPDDFRKVLEGYACPDCLAEFYTYLPQCPVCGFKRDVALDIQQAPDYWTQHLKDRESGYQAGTPDPANIDQHLARVGGDPDVEHIPLKKLKKTRKGARRS